MSKLQSAYRKFHSSETALLYVQNDILSSLDAGHSTALLLLDLSAAFDTIDHSILTHRLQHWFGISPVCINLNLNTISPSECAKNLGVIFQSDMSMDKHISSVVKTCFHQLREFRHIRSFIPKSAAIIFANAFIHSRIDYCNSLFYGLPKYSINRLQKIQNSVARIVTRTSRSSHITPVLKSLHWLPVQYRINFKLCCITHRALSLKEPYYLNSLLINRLNSHSLRSSSFNPLTLPFFNKKSNGFRSFAHAAPFLWNHLPNTVRSAPTYLSFRKSLKTYFFNQAFPT